MSFVMIFTENHLPYTFLVANDLLFMVTEGLLPKSLSMHDSW